MSADEDVVLDRSGHLAVWVFDRLRVDPRESAPDFFAAADRHLAACAQCRAARAALDAEIDDLPLLLPRAGPARRRGHGPTRALRAWLIGGAGVLAAAAVLLIVARPAPEAVVAKGSRLDFEVHVDAGAGAALVQDGASIRPGSRAGFRLRAAADGFALVFGWDDRGAPYPVYPTEGLRGVAVIAAAAPETLPAAIAFDDVGRSEHLAAIWCPTTFDLDALGLDAPIEVARVEVAARERGCLARVVHLVKAP